MSYGTNAGPDLLGSDVAGHLVGPAVECAAEIRGVVEPQRQRNVLVGELRGAEIFQGDLCSQFVEQAAKREALLPELTPQRALIGAEGLCYRCKAGRVRDIPEQKRADLACNPNTQLQIVKQTIAQGDDGRISRLVAEACGLIQPF